jgi:hypothetical protein
MGVLDVERTGEFQRKRVRKRDRGGGRGRKMAESMTDDG